MHSCTLLRMLQRSSERSPLYLWCSGRLPPSRAAQKDREVCTGAITLAKTSVVPVRRGYWGNKIGKPHTVPTKATGKCGSVTVRSRFRMLYLPISTQTDENDCSRQPAV